MAPFAALLAVVLAWGLVSRRLDRYSITLPIVLVAMGAVLSAIHVVVVELDTEAVRILVELALSILLFADATEISAKWLRSAGRLPLRMLALGFPLTVATGFATGYFLFPGAGVWIVALLAAALAATDAALASPVIMDERIPRRLRRIIDVESGLNDGLATPLVLFFCRSRGQRRAEGGGPWSRAGRARHRRGGGDRSRWALLLSAGGRAGATPREQLAVLVLPVITYLATNALGGNGFIAAVAGTAAPWAEKSRRGRKQRPTTSARWCPRPCGSSSIIPDVVARGF
jgi:NhaP-type Na+/H+ or K+/H+ antiporter